MNHFYASQYVESNFQYSWYLKCLKAWGQTEALNAAQPNLDIWDIPTLTEEEQAYLKAHYWSSEEFEHYPVVGLNPAQVNAYLEWKTDMLNLAKHLYSTKKLKLGKEEIVINGLQSEVPIPFNTKEYLSRTSTGNFKPYWATRLPTFQGLMALLPSIGKRTKERVAQDKGLNAWLRKMPEFEFLWYNPKNVKLKNEELRMKLERMGIRPVKASDLKKQAKKKNANLLPLLLLEQRFPLDYYKKGFMMFKSEEELALKKNQPDFNPDGKYVVVFDLKQSATVAYTLNKGKLVSLSIATAEERPLYGFRAVMTKPD